MIQGSLRRDLRRITAVLAGTAVAAATIGLAAPAHAAESTVSGIITDAAGNPISGSIYGYEQNLDGTFDEWPSEYLSFSNGVLADTIEDGVYKFEASTGAYSEFYLDKADLATADPVTVTGGSVGLPAWVLDQPYVTATVTDAAGRPVRGADVYAYNAADATAFVASDSSNEHGQVVLPVGTDPVKIRTYGVGRLSGEWYSDKVEFGTADAVTGTPGGTQLAIGLSAGATMTGRVVSDAGVPLEQVLVQAGSSSDDGADLTDKSGVFVIEGLDAGQYQVRFSDEQIQEYVTEYWNNTTDSAAATTVAVGVGAFVGGIDANLTPRPAKPAGSYELTGVISDDTGAPVVGAQVEVWTSPAAPFKKESTSVYSNRAGNYAFDNLDVLSGKTVKVEAQAPTPGDDDGYSLFGQWHGQRTSYERAAAVPLAAGVPARADISLPRSGGISGSILGAPGKGLRGQVSVVSVVDGVNAGVASTKADDTFEHRWLYPGTYKVLFSDSTGNHVPEWWKDDTFENAKEITVKSGETITDLAAVLDASLSTTERPSLKGYPWVGKSIKVDAGEWNYETGTQYSYEWLIGSDVVGTGEYFTPTKKQIGDKLKVRVLAENGELAGIATTARSEKIGYKSKIKVKVRGDKASIKIKAQKIKGKKVKGKVTVKEFVRVKNDGTIKYKKIGKTKIKKGKGTVSLKKLKKGKHKVVFFFKGKGKVGSSELTKKVKTKR